ncbi:heparanase-like [Anneissia japonica]|uniref:heparanase-like n=1 Tax=Anneissia japonica TaxID=1529436 RepID=UPI0014256FFA|nr:heparanase-like [Anneissia japonica]
MLQQLLHSISNTGILFPLVHFLCSSCCACLVNRIPPGNSIDYIKLYVSTDKVINVVNDRFVSVAIDSSEIRKHWNYGKLNFSSPQLQTLSASLHPAYLRLGGTSADFLIYKDTILENHKVGKTKSSTNFTMKEPNQLENITNITISGGQLALDYCHLRRLLDSYVYYRHNFIMGPSVTNPSGSSTSDKQPSLTYLTDFYQNGGGDAINASTWHQYYMDSRNATEDDFLDPDLLDDLITQIQSIKGIVYKYKLGSKIWLGETSSAYGSGADGLSNAYVSGFMWLDKLGVAAFYGIDVVIRQTLYGGNYALLDEDLEPLPDWWLSLLYKRLVGQRVLEVTTSARGGDSNLRLLRSYAHCSLTSSEYAAGDVTVYILNLDKYSSKSISITEVNHKIKGIDQYLLTSHGESGMRSKFVDLNGVKLEMVDERTLPDLPPKQLDPKQDILIPPLSFGFYVMKGADASACLK